MKLVAMMAISALMGTAATPKQGGERVTVYISYDAPVDMILMATAQGLATQMFAGIGVDVEWHGGIPPAGKKGAIAIELVTHTKVSLHPDALAYTRPYEGIHIQILWNRVKMTPCPSKLLAHVMVHEITHILEGIDRHSEEGVMKGRWNEADFEAMGFKPLPFAPEDVMIIHAGLKARNSGVMAPATQGEMMAAIPTRGN
jgi:hypothetical protein